MQEVALVDRLHEQLVLVAPPLRARPARDDRAGATALAAAARPVTAVGVHERRQQAAFVAQQRRQALERVRAHSDAPAALTPAKLSAAALTVRSICCGVWASDMNQASNCDGGG